MRVRYSIPVLVSLVVIGSASGASQSLGQVASGLTGEQVTVERGITPTTLAATDISTNTITLRPRIWNTLTAIPKYDYMTTPWAVAIFAHELGHIVRGMSEQDANCYAKANLYRVARALGFGPYKAKLVTYWGRQDTRTFC